MREARASSNSGQYTQLDFQRLASHPWIYCGHVLRPHLLRPPAVDHRVQRQEPTYSHNQLPDLLLITPVKLPLCGQREVFCVFKRGLS